MASRRELNSYSLSTQYKIRPVTLPQENKHNMYKVCYPDNIKNKVKDWLEKEGFPAWYRHKTEHEWGDFMTVHLVIQFTLERLDMLGERCQDNTNMFMGNTIKTIFNAKALHTADLITKCTKYTSYMESDIRSYRKMNLGIEYQGGRDNIYEDYTNMPKYFISKQLSNYLTKTKMANTHNINANSRFMYEEMLSQLKYSLIELFVKILNHTEEKKEAYYDIQDDNSYSIDTILTENTELENLFKVKAIERYSLKVYIARHLFTSQNVITKVAEKGPKYIFEDHIKGTADRFAIESLRQIAGDAQRNYTFSPATKLPILRLN